MALIDLFKNKQPENPSVVATQYANPKNYPADVLAIHHEFEVAADKLVEQAIEIINAQPKVNETKIQRLAKFGFKQVKEAEEGLKVLETTKLSREQIELVNYYRQNYPFNKFITEAQVKEICHKYNLVCGDVGRYRGFVPDANLKDIEGFRLKPVDDCKYYVSGPNGDFPVHESEIKDSILRCLNNGSGFNSYFVQFSSGEINVEGGEQRFGLSARVYTGSLTFKICAPVKDMDISGLELVEGYKLQRKHIPDPVVLQPVKGGYLVVTAWGDEASDPIIVNENFN